MRELDKMSGRNVLRLIRTLLKYHQFVPVDKRLVSHLG